MVTPENGQLVLKSTDNKRFYSLNLYSSDVIGGFVTMNANGLAVSGSQTFYIIPEPCYIEDISLVTGQTVSTAWVPQLNDTNMGSVIQYTTILTTLNQRSVPHLYLPGGAKFTLLQQ